MPAKINYKADEVWTYFINHKNELKYTPLILAEYDEGDVKILLSNVMDFCTISVLVEEVPIWEETAGNTEDCYICVTDFYDEYLKPVDCGDIEDYEDTDYSDIMTIQDEIDAREQEIDDAITLLVETATDGGVSWVVQEEICEDLKEHFLEYMARKHGLPIYRPMYLEDEDGQEFLAQYPYDQIIYDDPDNPLYKA